VIDLSDRVSYPMRGEAGDRWLLFNGEIYDHRELRRELVARGHRFSTDCDAEVVLHGYEEWGFDVFRRLNGIFALALLDERRGETLLARDRFGVKPLVRTLAPPFAFASDAMALVGAGLSRGEFDEEAIEEFASFHYVPSPRTGLKDLAQVEPGSVVRRTFDGLETTHRFAPAPFGTEASPEATLEEVDDAIGRAVARQLVADVPVGVFLSGGIDSALVMAYALEAGARPLAFTLAFPGFGDYDESARAALSARELGVELEVAELDMGFVEAVGEVAGAFDQPFADASALPTLVLARRARRDVTVALSGTGGDDLFAGYQRHRAHLLRPLLGRVPETLRRRLARTDARRGAERRSPLSFARSRAARLAQAAGGDVDQYLSLIGSLTSPEGLEALRAKVDPVVARERLAEARGLRSESALPTLRRLQRFELGTYLDGDLLTKEDRTTMAVGLEARVPLLDLELASVAERLPPRLKVSLFAGKRVLRALARRRLPASISSGRKRGFAVPLADLFAGPWRKEAVEWFSDSDSSLVNGVTAASLAERGVGYSTDLWSLAMLLSWERRVEQSRIGAQTASRGTAIP
jgi:asparagine synthase (glutamine-hydrolysing)